MKTHHSRTEGTGFTLAEVAVTLVIVGITLLLVMEGLNSSKMTAAQSNSRKIALELGLLTIARVECGQFWEELDGLQGSFSGTYAEEGYEAFQWELIIGDDEFTEYDERNRESAYFDSYAHRRSQQQEYEEDENLEQDAYGETGSTGGPYERVTIRVIYPKLIDQPNELVLERWIPLDQVFGKSDEQIDQQDSASESEGGDGR